MISFFLPAGPTRAVRSSRASSGGRFVGGVGMNSEREGPVLRRSWNVVRGRGEVRSVAEGSGAAVAKVRDEIWVLSCGLWVMGEERRHCSLVTFEAMFLKIMWTKTNTRFEEVY